MISPGTCWHVDKLQLLRVTTGHFAMLASVKYFGWTMILSWIEFFDQIYCNYDIGKCSVREKVNVSDE